MGLPVLSMHKSASTVTTTPRSTTAPFKLTGPSKPRKLEATRPAPRRVPLPGRGRGREDLRPSWIMQAAGSAESLMSIDGNEAQAMVTIKNNEAKDFTEITIEAQQQGYVLVRLTSAFNTAGLQVVSAVIQNEDGRVKDVFRVRAGDGHKVPADEFEPLQNMVLNLLSSSSRSNKPAIYGIVAAAEAERLRPLSSGHGQTEMESLELAAAEMAQAAAELVAQEREILALKKLAKKGATAKDATLVEKEAGRSEAAAQLERKMSAMEAVLAARRTILAEPEEESKPNAAALIEKLKPPSGTRAVSGAGSGTGYEVLFQGFNWESHKTNHYKILRDQCKGYLPRDLYKLDSAYGTEQDLRELISTMHELGMKAIADIVINHRCASYQGPDGKWNKFGGRLAWDASAICSNNPKYGGTGRKKNSGDEYAAAPNIDHTQENIRKDVAEWLRFLRNSVGFDGWRLDFVRGYSGSHCKYYIDETVPEMAFGEFWDSCEYSDGVLNYNQDAHRQRTINWCDSTGGLSGAFDFTTKGILQEAVGRKEYWRLSDSQGRPPGLMGMWPSKAISFIDNHDTGSTLKHWPFPTRHLTEGYAYILTHPGTPTVFYDHFYEDNGGLKKAIWELVGVRTRNKINCRSKVIIKKSTNDVYAALIDDRVALKIGFGEWSPNGAGIKFEGKPFRLVSSGFQYAVWEADV